MKTLLILSLSLLLSLPTAGQEVDYSFRDTTLADDKRVDILLRQLTIDEKVALLSTSLGVPRLGIPHCGHYEGLHGLALGGPGNWGGRKRNPDGTMSIQTFPTTIFPQSYGLGSTWSPEAVKKVAEQTAEEARYYFQKPENPRGSLVMRAPNADLARDPRWGRTEESFGEDAFLTGQLTVAHVKGLQGDHPRYWKTASLMKHFLANSNEDGRDSTSSDFSERLFHEYYAYPFRKGILEGGSQCFMAAYNSWNGIPMLIHPCLEEIARKQWDVKGIICTDGSALKLLVNAHKTYPTLAEGAAAVVKATTGQFLDDYEAAIWEALGKKMLTEAEIDKAIRGNLYVALKLGLLDGENPANPYLHIGKEAAETPPYEREEVKALVRSITAQSVVLLKNDKVAGNGQKLLPLQKEKLKKIALIGPYADKIVQDWYSGRPPYEVTILDGLRHAVEADTEILYTPDNRMSQAEKIAKEADIALVCVGNHPYGTRADWKFSPVPSDGREAVDRKSLQLPDEDLVKQVMKANPNTILVLVSSFPYAINWSQEHVPAIVHITHCSQEQGNGLADVLFGAVNPAGRTTQTWPKDITDLPDMMDYDLRNGRTYQYFKGEALYPFGHGLSYSDFRYCKLQVTEQDAEKIQLTVSVENLSQRDGEEVVQCYASYPDSEVSRPQKQLCAFKRVSIRAGERVEVVLTIDKDDLKYWNEAEKQFILEKGKLLLQVGGSSASTPLRCNCRL